MKRRLISVLLVLTMMLALAACGGKQAATKNDESTDAASTTSTTEKASTEPKQASDEILIGVALKTLSSEFWQYVKNGLEEGAKEAGVTVKVVGPPSESDVTGQVAMIEALITEGVDAICVAPNQPDAVSNALDKAIEANIPVYFIDTDAPFEKKTAFFGPGNEAAAELGGNHIAKILPKGSNVVIIRGRLGDVVHDQRVNGFSKPLKEAGINVLEVQPGDSTADRAMAVMEDFLQKYDKIDAVLCNNDEMAQGAARAAKQAGREGIKFIGFGGNEFILDPILNGEIEGTISINPFDMGKTAVLNMVKVHKGEKIDAFVDTGASLITKENAEEYRENLKKLLGK